MDNKRRRSSSAAKNRWNSVLRRQCTKFNTVFGRVKSTSESGTIEDDAIKKAIKLHCGLDPSSNDISGRLPHLKAWKVLRCAPKWKEAGVKKKMVERTDRKGFALGNRVTFGSGPEALTEVVHSDDDDHEIDAKESEERAVVEGQDGSLSRPKGAKRAKRDMKKKKKKGLKMLLEESRRTRETQERSANIRGEELFMRLVDLPETDPTLRLQFVNRMQERLREKLSGDQKGSTT